MSTAYGFPSRQLAPLLTHLRLRLHRKYTPAGKVMGAVINPAELGSVLGWTPEQIETGMDRLQELGLFAKWRFRSHEWRIEVLDNHRMQPIKDACRRGHPRSPETVKLDMFGRIVCERCKAKSMPRSGRAYRQRKGDIPSVREAVCIRGHDMGITSQSVYRTNSDNQLSLSVTMCLICARATNRLVQRYKRANHTAIAHGLPQIRLRPTSAEVDAEVARWHAEHGLPPLSIYSITPLPDNLSPVEQRVFEHLRARRGLWVSMNRLRASVSMLCSLRYATTVVSRLKGKLVNSVWALQYAHGKDGTCFRRLIVTEARIEQAA